MSSAGSTSLFEAEVRWRSVGEIMQLCVISSHPGGREDFGPYSTHPEDEEALISYKFYLKGLTKYEEDGILYVLAEEVPR